MRTVRAKRVTMGSRICEKRGEDETREEWTREGRRRRSARVFSFYPLYLLFETASTAYFFSPNHPSHLQNPNMRKEELTQFRRHDLFDLISKEKGREVSSEAADSSSFETGR